MLNLILDEKSLAEEKGEILSQLRISYDEEKKNKNEEELKKGINDEQKRDKRLKTENISIKERIESISNHTTYNNFANIIFL